MAACISKRRLLSIEGALAGTAADPVRRAAVPSLLRPARRAKIGRWPQPPCCNIGAISVSDYRCTPARTTRRSSSCTPAFDLLCPQGQLRLAHPRPVVRTGGRIDPGRPSRRRVRLHPRSHACGDECLSFFLAPELVESIGDQAEIWRSGGVPPLPELMVLGELAQAAADGRSDIGLDEVGLLSRRASSTWSPDAAPKPTPARWRATAAAPSKPRCGSTRTRIEPIDLETCRARGRAQPVPLPAPVLRACSA